MDPYAFEKQLASMEGIQARCLNDFMCLGIGCSSELREEIITFISVMRSRNPATKDYMKSSFQAMARDMAEMKIKHKNLDINLADYELKIKNTHCLEKMFRVAVSDKVLTALFKMRITLYRAPLGLRFITGDQSVSIFHPDKVMAGPNTPGTELTFPLTSHSLIKLDNFLGSDEERIADEQDVAEFNRRTIISSRDYIYTGDSPESLTEMIKAYSTKHSGMHFIRSKDKAGFTYGVHFTPVSPSDSY